MTPMTDVNLSTVDLNLLVVLGAVLETSSATRAAQRLHVTQSAVSNALRRAREVFGDPLFVRTARGLSPTPLAVELAPRLERWLGEARGLLGAERFDPKTTTRRFTLAGTDALAATLFPPLLRRFRARFPAASLRLVTLERMVREDGLGSGDVDLHLGIPPRVPSGCLSSPLYEDRFVVVASRRLRVRRMTLATFASLPHVENALFGEPDDEIDRQLEVHGLRRRIVAAVPHLALLPRLVAETDGISVVAEELVRASSVRARLVTYPVPLPLPPLRFVSVWHRRSDADPGHRALRALVDETVRASRAR